MDLALYHQKHGYYVGSKKNQIGREGDFYTSVSVGRTFGMLLSFAIEKKWNELCPDRDSPLVIVEQGAHRGQLARDILDSFRERNSPLLEEAGYRIIDPHESVNCDGDLDDYRDRIQIVESFAEARAPRGIFLCNELLDAFPVRRFTWIEGEWREWFVGIDPGKSRLFVVQRSISGDREDLDFMRFQELVAPYQQYLENGYTTEFCPSLRKWMKDCSSLFEEAGCWWVIDYGYEAADYFDPLRTTGTLRCFDQHRAHEDPLSRPGETDLTAHVNFTDLRDAGIAAGLQFSSLVDQSVFLTRAASDWLVSMDGNLPDSGNAHRLRQFKTLTHPSMMGQCFRFTEFCKEKI